MVILHLCVFSAVSSAAADDKVQFDYDIFWAGDTLFCWLDPTPALTQQKMEDLLAGLDIFFDFEIKLERPRKLLLKKTLIERRAALQISHRVTEDIYQIKFSGSGYAEYEFASQLQVSDFLTDSLIFRLVTRRSLKDEGNPRLSLSFSCKSLNPKGLATRQGHDNNGMSRPEGASEGLFDDAFGLFLDLIGFGETKYHITSPVFNPDNLDSFNR